VSVVGKYFREINIEFNVPHRYLFGIDLITFSETSKTGNQVFDLRSMCVAVLQSVGLLRYAEEFWSSADVQLICAARLEQT
jgi:hypothetical protein